MILDFDATDGAVHGAQEGRFFHGYYDHHCFLPLYVTCGEQLLVSYLRPSDIDGAKHAWVILASSGYGKPGQRYGSSFGATITLTDVVCGSIAGNVVGARAEFSKGQRDVILAVMEERSIAGHFGPMIEAISDDLAVGP